ncbi:MAG TPA: phospholipase C, phosphocholine-specific [Rhodanobacteraceae bacterium]|nr:phospholipase C, phosphocholine-specific [Rhodanobacteraceae bacterium]
MRGISRRKFIGMSASAAGAAALGTLPHTLSRALATPAAGRSLSAVRHVVVLMQENRSFDHYFGTLAGVRGFDDPAAPTLGNGDSAFAQPDSNGGCTPFHLDSRSGAAPCVPDLDHSWDSTHRAWNEGRYDRWVDSKSTSTMGYCTRADIPFHYALADAFTICDHYFCSVMGPTNPNRLYLWSGTLDAEGHAGGPVVDNHATGFRWTTYPERLEAAGVDWKVYQNANDNYDDNALAWFARFQHAAPGSSLFERGMASVPATSGSTANDIVAALRSDVLGGTLPTVSWIVAPESCSEHPAWPAAAGAHFIDGVMRALMADPEVWASTVLFLNYDENDGYFDHVPPPVPPPGMRGEFVRGEPIGLGPRVPMLVISPWSRGGCVCSETFDHTSVIRFLETWLGVSEPNISAWRRAICGDMTSVFDFNSLTIALPDLPETSEPDFTASQACARASPQIAGTNSVPSQESGARPLRPLPYRPDARLSFDEGALRVRMSNADTKTSGYASWAHFTIQSRDGKNSPPRRYDVPPGEWIEDVFAPNADGSYEISVYGPAGFVRRFAGRVEIPASEALVLNRPSRNAKQKTPASGPAFS